MQARELWITAILLTVAASGGCQTLGGGSDADSAYDKTRLGRDDPSARSDNRPVAYQEPADEASLDEDEDPSLAERFERAIGRGPDKEQARELYREGDVLFREASRLAGEGRKDKFVEAAAKFAAAGDRWPGTGLEEDALYMAGESYFFSDRYADASETYSKLIKRHAKTRYMDVVAAHRYAIARYWMQLHRENPRGTLTPNFTDVRQPLTDTFGSALRIFDQIRRDDPTGELADDATLAAGNAYFSKGKYQNADDFYVDFIKQHPNSPYQFEAHLLSLKCKLNLYQGADYGIEPLSEAEALIKKVHRVFHEQAAAEVRYLDEAYKEVRHQFALREWTDAQIRERRGEYGAARFHYDLIVNKYSDTPLAAQARERLAEIDDRPAVPPNRFAWFTNLFEPPDEEAPLAVGSLPSAGVDVR